MLYLRTVVYFLPWEMFHNAVMVILIQSSSTVFWLYFLEDALARNWNYDGKVICSNSRRNSERCLINKGNVRKEAKNLSSQRHPSVSTLPYREKQFFFCPWRILAGMSWIIFASSSLTLWAYKGRGNETCFWFSKENEINVPDGWCKNKITGSMWLQDFRNWHQELRLRKSMTYLC